MAGVVRLYDVDYESATQNEQLGCLIQEHPDAVGDWEYRAVETLSETLDGADFVVCSTQDPPEETMVHDLDVPQQYGIYQTVGDTVGPGGTFRAMRAIPQYREIASAIREYCPNAWVINYTNPMTVCTQTLYEEFPEIKAMGICHEVYGTQGFLASLVEKHLEEDQPPRNEIDINVKGVNHFTWIDEAYWRGKNLMSLVELEAETYDPPSYDPGEMTDESFYTTNHEVTFDLYDRFNILPAAGDRHLAEFVPWYLDIDHNEEIHRWGIRLTPSDHRREHWSKGESSRQALLQGEESFDFRESGEEMVDIMRALLGIEPMKTNANVPNQGQISDLPIGAVVETNVLFTNNNCTPLTAGGFPPVLRNLIGRNITNQETLLEASFEGDLDLAFQAFLNDPLVTIDTEEASQLFIDLIEQERSYLMDWDFDNAAILDS
ncbi:alpha-galacturonidase LplD [Halobacterium noricense]|uniref:Alpha-galacturonidase LplD n=2 Tax=Haladaptatus pallidirubidus TaxID=1008152 RepID=A0AAV3UPH9_9EURY